MEFRGAVCMLVSIVAHTIPCIVEMICFTLGDCRRCLIHSYILVSHTIDESYLLFFCQMSIHFFSHFLSIFVCWFVRLSRTLIGRYMVCSCWMSVEPYIHVFFSLSENWKKHSLSLFNFCSTIVYCIWFAFVAIAGIHMHPCASGVCKCVVTKWRHHCIAYIWIFPSMQRSLAEHFALVTRTGCCLCLWRDRQ